MFSVEKPAVCTLSVVVLAATAGCGSEPSPRPDTAMPSNTAVVSIDGRGTGERYYVACRNQKWQLTIDTIGEGAGFTAMLKQDAGLDAQMVKIRDLGGFTGSAWRGGVGDVEARRDAGVMTITGTGYGYFGDQWRGPADAAFTIRAAC